VPNFGLHTVPNFSVLYCINSLNKFFKYFYKIGLPNFRTHPQTKFSKIPPPFSNGRFECRRGWWAVGCWGGGGVGAEWRARAQAELWGVGGMGWCTASCAGVSRRVRILRAGLVRVQFGGNPLDAFRDVYFFRRRCLAGADPQIRTGFARGPQGIRSCDPHRELCGALVRPCDSKEGSRSTITAPPRRHRRSKSGATTGHGEPKMSLTCNSVLA